jgi:hypothetical protein
LGRADGSAGGAKFLANGAAQSVFESRRGALPMLAQGVVDQDLIADRTSEMGCGKGRWIESGEGMFRWGKGVRENQAWQSWMFQIGSAQGTWGESSGGSCLTLGPGESLLLAVG